MKYEALPFCGYLDSRLYIPLPLSFSYKSTHALHLNFHWHSFLPSAPHTHIVVFVKFRFPEWD